MIDFIKKCKFKDVGVVINAPAIIENELLKIGFNNKFTKSKSTNTLVFINDKKAYIHFLTTSLQKVEPDTVLWFAYTKSTSKIITDINRDIIREIGEQFGITTVTAISIDDTWSALRFRPIDKVGK